MIPRNMRRTLNSWGSSIRQSETSFRNSRLEIRGASLAGSGETSREGPGGGGRKGERGGGGEKGDPKNQEGGGGEPGLWFFPPPRLLPTRRWSRPSNSP